MRSEKAILLRRLVALLAVSSATSWIQSVQGLKFSPINKITLETEVTIDWTGQPSLGNVEQSVVLMKDGNALLTLCQGQITGSGQCSFELKEEHQVLGDGYQLAKRGMDGVALDYSAEFPIKAGDVKVESSSGGGEEEDVEEKGDEDEVEVEVVEDKDYCYDEGNDKEGQRDGDDDDAKVEKKRTGHDDDEDDGDVKKKKHGYQKSQVHEQKAKDDKQQQQQQHHNKQQNKKQPKQHKRKKQRQQQKDGYYKQQVNKLFKTFQQQQKEQHQHRFTVMSTGSREQRAKEAARLLEKNRRRREMLLVARRHQYLRIRQQALRLQASINSIFDQLTLPMAHAAEPPRARVVVSAPNDADESNEDSNGINAVFGNDAYAELIPEHPIQKVATGAVAGGTDEIDMELADEQEPYPDKKDEKEKEKAEQADAKEKEGARTETKDEAELSTWHKVLGSIALVGKKVGTTVADGFTKVQHVVVGGGANAPEGEL